MALRKQKILFLNFSEDVYDICVGVEENMKQFFENVDVDQAISTLQCFYLFIYNLVFFR